MFVLKEKELAHYTIKITFFSKVFSIVCIQNLKPNKGGVKVKKKSTEPGQYFT